MADKIKTDPPMEGEVAKISREYVLSALRWREVSEFDGRGRNGLTIEQTADLICDRLANALESLSRRNEGDGWQPIETAKKDGTWFSGYEQPENGGKYPGHVVMRWRESSWRSPGWYADGGNGYCGCEPTHWRPLQPPPETAKEVI